MKPRNFPARKLRRQINAQTGNTGIYTKGELTKIETARNIRTKKRRA
ncbi:MAG: hypothetical protein V3U60_11160 [Gammaproteobacteria bacterium]